MSDNVISRIILSGYLKTGDRVVITDLPDYNRYPDLPVGTVLQCVGHRQWHCDIDFGWIRPNAPRGRYLRFGAAVFEVCKARELFPQYEDKFICYNPHHLAFEDQNIDFAKNRRDTYEWNMACDGVRIGDLPETEFVVGDLVDLGSGMEPLPDDVSFAYCRIENVTYGLPETPQTLYDVGVYVKKSDGTVARAYSRPYLTAEDLTLKQRGNFYHWQHDKSKIAFADLKEEVSFWMAMGRVVDVCNPDLQSYHWTLDEALLAIRAQVGAGMNIHRVGVDRVERISVYTFTDLPELEARVRDATLKGFAERLAELDNGAKVQRSLPDR